METSGRNHERAAVAAAPRGSASSIPDLPESFFRTVIETANEGVWMIDASGTTTFANARMAAMLGLSASDMLGKPALNVVYPDDLSIAGRVIPATLAGDAQEFQVRFLRADGSIIPMLGGSAPFRDADGKVLGAIATFSDLSAQKQVETELRTSQAQLANQLAELAALYDSAPIGLGFFDREYRYLRINDELAAINGVPAAEHLGRSIREVLPHNAPHVEPIIDQVFATGTAVRDLEVSGETPQQPGVNCHWLTGFYPVKNSAGEVEAVGAWVVEISERKAAEQREVLLAREVDHRAKNLLAVVQAVVQLTRADSTEELKEAVLGRIQALARAHSLLANARWDGAQIGDLIREELAPYLGTPSERVRVDGPVMLLRPAAAQSLGMVIHELATNAAKYGALSVASGRLEVGWRMAGDMVELSWFETGGPPTAPPTSAGFGSQIIKVTIGRQLHGQLEQEWLPDGLKCTMRVSAKEALSDVASDPRPPPCGTGQGG